MPEPSGHRSYFAALIGQQSEPWDRKQSEPKVKWSDERFSCIWCLALRLSGSIIVQLHGFATGCTFSVFGQRHRLHRGRGLCIVNHCSKIHVLFSGLWARPFWIWWWWVQCSLILKKTENIKHKKHWWTLLGIVHPPWTDLHPDCSPWSRELLNQWKNGLMVPPLRSKSSSWNGATMVIWWGPSTWWPTWCNKPRKRLRIVPSTPGFCASLGTTNNVEDWCQLAIQPSPQRACFVRCIALDPCRGNNYKLWNAEVWLEACSCQFQWCSSDMINFWNNSWMIME